MGSEPYLKDYQTGSVEDRSQSGRPTGINQEKIGEFNDFLQSHPQSSVQSVAKASSVP